MNRTLRAILKHRRLSSKPIMNISSNHKIIFSIILANIILYFNVHGFDFISLDDHENVYQNPFVQRDLSFLSIFELFSTYTNANWQPVTQISFLIEHSIFGLNPAGYHITNVIIHTISSILVFIFLYRLTENRLLSFLAALIFSLHPLNVESVAWVSERRGLLSSLFFLLCINSYIKFRIDKKHFFYLVSIFLFVLSLLSKPVTVYVPVIVFLLDYLFIDNRLNLYDSFKRALPYLFITIIFSLITLYGHYSAGSLPDTALLSLTNRVVNAVNSYIMYIVNFLYPTNLVFHYPYPRSINWQLLFVSAPLLTVSSILVYKYRHKTRLAYFGWLWFLISLLPVSGLIQTGSHAMADRYMYIPMIGLLFILINISMLISEKITIKKDAFKIVTALYFILLLFTSTSQLQNWKNSYLLYTHAIDINKDNTFALNALAYHLFANGHINEAIKLISQSVNSLPYQPSMFEKASDHLIYNNRLKEAEILLKHAISRNKRLDRYYRRLGLIKIRQNQYTEAKKYYALALKEKPGDDSIIKIITKLEEKTSQ